MVYCSITCQQTPAGSMKLTSRPHGKLVGGFTLTPGKLVSMDLA